MKPGKFKYFVLIASMRTGSNLFEELVNAHPDLRSFGELFNPHFVGSPNKDSALGVTRESRQSDPIALVNQVRDISDRLGGFRLFDGHDQRVLDHVLADPDCAKITLRRNPLESYASLRIARQTKQWWLGNVKKSRSAKVEFDPVEFAEYLDNLDQFHDEIHQGLLSSGQPAFALGYEDLRKGAAIEGLYRFLGVDPIVPPEKLRGKVQNPQTLEEKFSNPDTARSALTTLDPFKFDRIPDFEPARGAATPSIVITPNPPLAYLPLGAPDPKITAWLEQISQDQKLQTGLGQDAFKSWMRGTPDHLCFAVLRHPVERAYAAFECQLLNEHTRDQSLYALLKRDFDLPKELEVADLRDGKTLHAGFLVFLKFVQATLGGQTGFRIHPSWASQKAMLDGVAQLRHPDILLRPTEVSSGISWLEVQIEQKLPEISTDLLTPPDMLLEIYDSKIEKAARAAYRHDYAFLGFSDFRSNR